jgi:hypothetical protein
LMRGKKLQDDVADLDLVGIGERSPLVDGRAVEVRAVATSQIFEEEMSVPIRNLGMLPADGGVVQNDLAAWMPAQHHPLTAQFQNLPGAVSFDDLKKSHGSAASTDGRRCVRGKEFDVQQEL